MITGRKQVLLFSQGEIASLSADAYKEVLAENKLSENARYIAQVREVGLNLTGAVERYIEKQQIKGALEGISWTFDVIQSDQINAFCLPNGSIVFYEGIMKLMETSDYIAVVMGHEIAHAVAKHGNERMSQQTVTNAVGEMASALLGTARNQALFNVAFGLGSQFGVLLPYSRQHEYEADRLGLIFMAMAGYDINVAPVLWEKMSGGSSGGSDFFSTHPSDAKRIENLNKVMVEARTYLPAGQSWNF